MMDTATDHVVGLRVAPAFAGFQARRFAGPADYEAIAALHRAANLADDVPWLPSTDNVRLDFESEPGTDPAVDVVIGEVDGRVVAATGVARVVRDERPTYQLWGAVDPAWRRRGIGAALHDWTTGRATERAAVEDPTGEVDLVGWAEMTETGHRALLVGAGFEEVRWFFLMRRDGLDEVPAAPLPDGLELRPVRPEEHRTIFDAEDEAFRDHWGHRPMTDDEFVAAFARAELDTGLWVVAWDGDRVAGVVQNWIWPAENAGLGVRRGWLEHVSVRRPWRRRGLARAMVAASLVRLRDAGMDEAMLGVDSQNGNGALGLYEGLGFTVRSRASAWRRPLER